MIPIWPADLPQRPRRDNWNGGPVEARVHFEPERGPPIERAGVTALTEVFSATFQNLTTAQRVAFRSWFATSLNQGVTWFAWRDPVVQDVALWKIKSRETAYEFTAKGAGWHDLALTLLRHPGQPWWAGYAMGGEEGEASPLRLPFVVADYANGVFGVDLVRGTAAAVAAVAGTFDVYAFNDDLTVDVALAEVVTGGDIPAAAPAGVLRILAFAP